MPKEGEKLRLGKGAAFVKSRLKRLSQGDETWEVDFRALPKPRMQSTTHYVGMIVSLPHNELLADLFVEQKPSVNHLARLLAEAPKR